MKLHFRKPYGLTTVVALDRDLQVPGRDTPVETNVETRISTRSIRFGERGVLRSARSLNGVAGNENVGLLDPVAGRLPDIVISNVQTQQIIFTVQVVLNPASGFLTLT